jgi:hypothetical protein
MTGSLAQSLRLAAFATLLSFSPRAVAQSSKAAARSAVTQSNAHPRLDTLVIDSVPRVTMGATANDELFDVAGGVLWGDTIVVAERSTKTLRFYLQSGKAIGSVGRSGSGPGEFQGIDWLMRSGNQLVTFDSEQKRLTIFGPSRRVASTATLTPRESYVGGTVAGRFLDGRLLLHEIIAAPSPTSDAYVVSRQAVLSLSGPGADQRDSVGSTRTTEYFIRTNPRGGGTHVPLLFGKSSQTVVAGRIAVMVENRGDSIAVLTLADRRWRVYGGLRPDPATPLTDDVVTRLKENRIKVIADASLRGAVSEAFKVMPAPTQVPRYGWFGEHAITMLTRTSTGAVWVISTSDLSAPMPLWTVIGAAGNPDAVVKAQSEMEVLDATSSLVLVRTWDRDGAERVELRGLRPLRATKR